MSAGAVISGGAVLVSVVYCAVIVVAALWVIGCVVRDMWRARRRNRFERYAAEALALCDAEADAVWRERMRAVAAAQAREVRR